MISLDDVIYDARYDVLLKRCVALMDRSELGTYPPIMLKNGNQIGFIRVFQSKRTAYSDFTSYYHYEYDLISYAKTILRENLSRNITRIYPYIHTNDESYDFYANFILSNRKFTYILNDMNIDQELRQLSAEYAVHLNNYRRNHREQHLSSSEDDDSDDDDNDDPSLQLAREAYMRLSQECDDSINRVGTQQIDLDYHI